MARRRHPRIKLKPRFFLIVAVLLVTIHLVHGYVSGYIRMQALKAEIAAYEAAIAELEARNAELTHRLVDFTDDEFVERIAREQLRLIEPGEIPVIVVDPTVQRNSDPID